MAYFDRAIGPDGRHPLTGVELNRITIKRRHLTFEEAVTAHILRNQGRTYTDIVHLLGTNANRIGEVFRGEVHKNAAEEAFRRMRD